MLGMSPFSTTAGAPKNLFLLALIRVQVLLPLLPAHDLSVSSDLEPFRSSLSRLQLVLTRRNLLGRRVRDDALLHTQAGDSRGDARLGSDLQGGPGEAKSVPPLRCESPRHHGDLADLAATLPVPR